MKKIKINSPDFLIIFILLIAAPIGYISKKIYNQNENSKAGEYSIQISVKDSIDNLNHYNFTKHYNSVVNAIDNGDKLGNFAACIVFNRYKDDLIMYNKDFYSSEELFKKDERKINLYRLCLLSYKNLNSKTSDKMTSSYYYTLGLANIYGFENKIDIYKSLQFFERAYDIDKNKEISQIIETIKKYKNIFPDFKDSVVLPYIDNNIKDNKL